MMIIMNLMKQIGLLHIISSTETVLIVRNEFIFNAESLLFLKFVLLLQFSHNTLRKLGT